MIVIAMTNSVVMWIMVKATRYLYNNKNILLNNKKSRWIFQSPKIFNTFSTIERGQDQPLLLLIMKKIAYWYMKNL